jgi:hypothetical protein
VSRHFGPNVSWYSITAQAFPMTIGQHPARQRVGGCVTSLLTWARPAEGSESTDTTPAAATITGVSTDFPAWATNRLSWRTAGLTIAGDTDYAEKFLDALHII